MAPMSLPRSISRANTACAWWSRAAAIAISGPRARPIRCSSGRDRCATSSCTDEFVARDCDGPAVPAVSVGAGALWMQAYDEVTTRGQRYVQGGGCATVGVAGLVQGGGFGSYSKRYGTAAASLLEVEVVTADGVVRTANAKREPRPILGTQRRRRRDLRRRHANDLAHARAAAFLRLGLGLAAGGVGRRLSGAARRFPGALCRSARRCPLGRDRQRPGGPYAGHPAVVPGPHRRRSGGDLAAVLREGRRRVSVAALHRTPRVRQIAATHRWDPALFRQSRSRRGALRRSAGRRAR